MAAPFYYARITIPQTPAGEQEVAVPFPYLNQDHVRAYVIPPLGSFEDAVEVPITWLSASLISVTGELNASLTVRRRTPELTPLSRFASATLSSAALNTNATQAIYLFQELQDAQTDQALAIAELLAPSVIMRFGTNAQLTAPLLTFGEDAAVTSPAFTGGQS